MGTLRKQEIWWQTTPPISWQVGANVIHCVPQRLPAPKLMPETAEPVQESCYLIARQFRRHGVGADYVIAHTLRRRHGNLRVKNGLRNGLVTSRLSVILIEGVNCI
jgi:hypothetical protein